MTQFYRSAAIGAALALAPVTLASAQESVKSTPKDTNVYSRAAVPADSAAPAPTHPNAAAPSAAPGAPPPTTTNVMRVFDVVVNNTNSSLKTTDTTGGSETSIAVNSNNRNQISISGFSSSWGGGNAALWNSSDGGQTWSKQFTIPAPPGAGGTSGCPCDQTFDFGTGNELFGTFLTFDGTNTNVYSGSTTNTASAASWSWWLVGGVAQKTNLAATSINNADQPWLLYNRGTGNAAFQNVFVGYDDFGVSPPATRVSASINLAPPQFTADVQTGNIGGGGINPGHRLAADPRNGWMYSLYQNCTANCGGDPKTISYMLNRSINQGTSWSLNGNALGISIASATSHQPTPKFGTVNALLGGIDHAAVDPSTGDLYYVYGEIDGSGNNNLAIRRVFDIGGGNVGVGAQNLVTSGNTCAIPSVAVTRHGTIGVLFYCFQGIVAGFPQFTAWLGVNNNQGATASWTYQALTTFLSPAVDSCPSTNCLRQRVLGDYIQMKAVDNCFYGGFVANRAAFFGSLAVDDPVFFKACYGQSASTHDPNGDGFSDIVWRNTTTGQLAMWFMSGTTIGSATGAGTVTTDWQIVGQRDFNGDGFSDLLWRNSSGQTAIWLMNGATLIGGGSLGTVTTDWIVAGTGDFNGDGFGDILWYNATTLQVAIWFMNGTTVLAGSGVLSPPPPSGWTILGTGDFNGDGMTDILWRNLSTGQNAIWQMNGGLSYSASGIGTVGTNWIITGTGDFNNDGNSDILWRDTTTGQIGMWFMNGFIVAGGGSPGTVPTVWTIVATGDFNTDGFSDLLWHDSSGNTAIWLMNGATILPSSAGLGNVATVWAIQGNGAD
jgi:hypothetical protein